MHIKEAGSKLLVAAGMWLDVNGVPVLPASRRQMEDLHVPRDLVYLGQELFMQDSSERKEERFSSLLKSDASQLLEQRAKQCEPS